MDLRLPGKLGAVAAIIALLLGSQPLAAECVSATLAEEAYYSCSGVLTVMPKRDGEDAGSVPEREVPVSGVTSERLDERLPASEARAATPGR